MSMALFINYIDRGNLATWATEIRADLALSNTDYGWLLAAFYLSYTFCQLPAGALADRYGGKLVLGVGAALWALSTLLTGFVTGFAALIVLRLMLGLGESVAFTTTSKIIAGNVPPDRIGLANGVIGFGYLVGPAIGVWVGGELLADLGWRMVFILFGAASLLWLIPWSMVRVASETDKRPVEPQVPLRAILARRELWGASLGHFAGNWNWYFILGYLPMYLETARGFSKQDMAWVVTWAYAVNAAAALAGGYLIDRAIRRGISPTWAFKLPMALAHLAGLGCMIAMPLLPIGACLACLFIYEIFLGFSSPGYFAIPQVLAGPQAAARWVGVQNMMGNLPGIIGLVFAGVLIDAGQGDYGTAFLIAGAINLLGLLGWLVILPRIRPIDWQAVRA
jgi:MFS family permease